AAAAAGSPIVPVVRPAAATAAVVAAAAASTTTGRTRRLPAVPAHRPNTGRAGLAGVGLAAGPGTAQRATAPRTGRSIGGAAGEVMVADPVAAVPDAAAVV